MKNKCIFLNVNLLIGRGELQAVPVLDSVQSEAGKLEVLTSEVIPRVLGYRRKDPCKQDWGLHVLLSVGTMTAFPPLRAGLQVKAEVPWNLGIPLSCLILESSDSTKIQDANSWSLLENCL